jgi:hypothetical protein
MRLDCGAQLEHRTRKLCQANRLSSQGHRGRFYRASCATTNLINEWREFATLVVPDHYSTQLDFIG